MTHWYARLSFFLLSISLQINAQQMPDSAPQKGRYYSMERNFVFPHAAKNEISDESNSLSPFFDRLTKMEGSVVSITHIGDSHTQADFQTSVTRRLFQERFGSAGRGLVAPLRLSKTNGPRNYSITSPQTWTAFRNVKQGDVPVGLTTIALQLLDTLANISVANMEEAPLGETVFNELIVFYDRSSSFLIVPDSVLLERRELIDAYSEKLILTQAQSSIDLNFYSPDKKEIVFYGIQLINGQPGVLYNVIGSNGAHFSDYIKKNLFAEQLAPLKTDLFIISLGVNDAYNRRLSTVVLYQEIDQLIKQIRQLSPQAVFILTTPAESWKRISRKKRIPLEAIESVRNTIVKYARDNRLAYWDLFAITGGKNSAKAWFKNGMFAGDRIHFTKEGYEYQGELLFQAIYNNYMDYSNGLPN